MASRRNPSNLASPVGPTLADLPNGRRCELIDGMLYDLPTTSKEHERIASLIVMAIRPAYQLGKGGPGGWWIQGEHDFEAGGREVFRSNAVGWRKQRLPRIGEGKRVDVVPDWVCEILSPSTDKQASSGSSLRGRTLKTKAQAYARIGVAHRWYVDPEIRVLHAFELARGRWIESGVFCDDDVVRVKPFEAIGLPMADWWSEPKKQAAVKMTSRQGEFLAFIHAYMKLHKRPPAEHEICSRFALSPPSVHDAIVRMEKAGLIARTPRQARSIRVLIPEQDIPPFDGRVR